MAVDYDMFDHSVQPPGHIWACVLEHYPHGIPSRVYWRWVPGWEHHFDPAVKLAVGDTVTFTHKIMQVDTDTVVEAAGGYARKSAAFHEGGSSS